MSPFSVPEKYALSNCKVLVVANPANTNALILKEYAPSVPEMNITCLTRKNTRHPDVNHASVKTPAGDNPVCEPVGSDEWLNCEFITTIQQRGAAITTARKALYCQIS